MSRVDEILAEARALRVTMTKRIAQLDEAIATFEKMKLETPPEVLNQILSGKDKPSPSSSAVADRNLTPKFATAPAQVVTLVAQELLSARRPMKRGEIVQALRANGHHLAGSDTNKNLGTILWRHPKNFVSIKGLGYWVRGVPLDGLYDPEKHDEQ